MIDNVSMSGSFQDDTSYEIREHLVRFCTMYKSKISSHVVPNQSMVSQLDFSRENAHKDYSIKAADWFINLIKNPQPLHSYREHLNKEIALVKNLGDIDVLSGKKLKGLMIPIEKARREGYIQVLENIKEEFERIHKLI